MNIGIKNRAKFNECKPGIVDILESVGSNDEYISRERSDRIQVDKPFYRIRVCICHKFQAMVTVVMLNQMV